MAIEFTGRSTAITATPLAKATSALGVTAAEIWTVLAVETQSCGFLADRRPAILYERHIFSHLTKGAYDDGDISSPMAGRLRCERVTFSISGWRAPWLWTAPPLCRVARGVSARSWA